MPNGRERLRAARPWYTTALITGLAAFAVTFGVLTTVERLRAKGREVRWLRARLAEKRDQLERERSDHQRVAAAVDRLVETAAAARNQTGTARDLARLNGPEVAPTATKDVVSKVSANTARMLEQIARAEHHTSMVRDSVAVLSALLKERRSTAAGMPSLWPVRGFVSSDFGYRPSPYGGGSEWHPGLDIQAPQGTTVQATGSGEVIFTGRDSGYGLLVIVAHGRNVESFYGHLSSIQVREGARVRRGDVLGQVGATGRATGNHLHFEVRENGDPVDPTRYLTARPERPGLTRTSRLAVGGEPGVAAPVRP